MTTHTVTFKPGAATLAALTFPLDTAYLEGYEYGLEGRYILPNVPFERVEKLGETLVESGARNIQITGIHYVQSYPGTSQEYPEDFIRLALTKLHETTGVDFTPLLTEEPGSLLDVRSEANAREAVRTLLGLGYEAKYHLTHALHWGAAPKHVRFEVNPNCKIQAIKLVRQWTGEGLKWAKDTVESGSIYISGGPLRAQAFNEALEPYVTWQGIATPLETFTLPKTIKDKEALAAHLEALAALIRNMDV